MPGDLTGSGPLAARAMQVIARTQHLPPDSITIDQTFAELKFDSLDGMNILFAIETEFDISIPDDQAVQIKSVREMVEGIQTLMAAKADHSTHSAGSPIQ